MEIRESTPLPLALRPSRPATTNPIRRRLRARLSSWRLDHVLAEGTDPKSDPLLACRADQLTSPDYRERLAEALRDSVAEAASGNSPGASVPLASASVRANSGLIVRLAARLDSSHAVEVTGVARARLLLVDSDSPLYGSASALELQSALEQALIGLGG
jgi:hypothetical protein